MCAPSPSFSDRATRNSSASICSSLLGGSGSGSASASSPASGSSAGSSTATIAIQGMAAGLVEGSACGGRTCNGVIRPIQQRRCDSSCATRRDDGCRRVTGWPPNRGQRWSAATARILALDDAAAPDLEPSSREVSDQIGHHKRLRRTLLAPASCALRMAAGRRGYSTATSWKRCCGTYTSEASKL